MTDTTVGEIISETPEEKEARVRHETICSLFSEQELVPLKGVEFKIVKIDRGMLILFPMRPTKNRLAKAHNRHKRR